MHYLGDNSLPYDDICLLLKIDVPVQSPVSPKLAVNYDSDTSRMGKT